MRVIRRKDRIEISLNGLLGMGCMVMKVRIATLVSVLLVVPTLFLSHSSFIGAQSIDIPTCTKTLDIPTDASWSGAVATWVHPTRWCSNSCLPATWIWKSYLADPDSFADMSKSFNITGTPNSGNIDVLVDDWVDIYVNNEFVGHVDVNFRGPHATIDIGGFLREGENNIRFHAYNGTFAYDPYENPAGVNAIAHVSFSSQNVKPSLTLNMPNPYWSTYADYLARELSTTWVIDNSGSETAYNVNLTSSSNTNIVSLTSTLPSSIGDITAGSSGSITLKYHVPVGVGSWRSTLTGSAEDGCGTTYIHP